MSRRGWDKKVFSTPCPVVALAKTDPVPYSAQNTTLPHTASTVCNQNVLCFLTIYNVEVTFYKYHKKCVHRNFYVCFTKFGTLFIFINSKNSTENNIAQKTDLSRHFHCTAMLF